MKNTRSLGNHRYTYNIFKHSLQRPAVALKQNQVSRCFFVLMQTCFRVSDSSSEDTRGLKASVSEERCKHPPACLLHGRVEAKEPVGQDYPAQQGAEETLGFRPFVRNISCVSCLWELQSKQKANFGTDVICPLKSKVSPKTSSQQNEQNENKPLVTKLVTKSMKKLSFHWL